MTFLLTLRLPHESRKLEIEHTDSVQSIAEVMAEAGLHLNTRCGYRSLCNGCQIELLEGSLVSLDSGEPIQSNNGPQLLRGCEVSAAAEGHAEVSIPARSLLSQQPQVVSSFRLDVSRAHDPLWQEIQLDRNNLADEQPSIDTLCRIIQRTKNWDKPVIPAENFETRQTSENDQFRFTCQRLEDHWQVSVSEQSEAAFGIAVDIGTTTVAAVVVDLTDGRIASNASALNAQTALGDNVLTRINCCMVKPKMTELLQKAIILKTLGPLIEQAIKEAKIQADQLVCMVVAGNTTMQHLLVGVNPSSMGTAPFTPTFLEHRVIGADELNLKIKSSTSTGREEIEAGTAPPHTKRRHLGGFPIHLLPGAAAYVGADITAGLLASGMAYSDGTSLLVDLGTNGEIVLTNGDTLLGCATAAGPAFEGAGLTCGVRAGTGAIGHVWPEDPSKEPRIDVIGGGQPIGLCGTAYVDFVARACRAGWLNAAGRFNAELAPHLIKHERYGTAFTVAHGRDNQPISITEADIASLLQAKAAIAAGIQCLLQRAGITSRDIAKVYLAGGFGFHMHVDSVLGCGLLPGFASDQIDLVGNTSLAGAYLALLDSGALEETKRLCNRIQIIELNLDPDFESTYIDHLSLPVGGET